MTTVLLVEDDPPVSRLVRADLEARGVMVTEAPTVAGAIDALRRRVFDVVILDLTLPDGSGLEVLRHLRDEPSREHIIVLSGAITEFDRVRGLELGADDYVVKPFSARELTARVLAVQRRRAMDRDIMLRIGPLEIDLLARRVTKDGAEVELTAREFSLLAFLAARPGQVFSRGELLHSVWQSEPGWQMTTTVTEHLRRLRTKIEVDPRHPRLLRTVRGIGYRLDLPEGSTPADHWAMEETGTVGRWVDVEGRIVHADAGAARLVGAADAAELLGEHVLTFVSPQSIEAVRGRRRTIESGRAPRSQVLVLRRLDGRQLPVQVSSAPVEWEGAPAISVEFVPAAEASAPFRELLTGIASELTDALIVTDMQSHIRSWNGGAERLYGWAEAEVLGRHILDIVDWADEGDLRAEAVALETTSHWRGRPCQRTRDGASVTVLASTTVVRDAAGEPLGQVLVNRLAPVLRRVRVGPHTLDELRQGLHNGELEVYYQPVVDLADRGMITVEALIRWNHPGRGLLAPGAFLGVAEGTDLILEIGAFVLESGCAKVAEWRRAGLDLSLAVNVSARELTDPGLADRIIATAAAAGLELRAVWLELTETSLIDDVERAGITLHRLAALGVGVSIDDFGTGWASLTYLRAFPIHVLKIDRSFVTDLPDSLHDRAIVRSILDLGAELGHVVVAEGVETLAQHDALVGLGCTVGQGYLYGRPTPADEVPLDRARRLPGDPTVTPAGSADR